jgi:protein-S-isoprenylcysteine O-methyltransferase Ste14
MREMGKFLKRCRMPDAGYRIKENSMSILNTFDLSKYKYKMTLFIVFVATNVLTHIIRTTYEVLKIRNRIDPEAKGMFTVIFTNMAVLWISWFNLCAFDPGILMLPLVLRYPGAALFLLGLALFVISLAQVKKFENYHGDLITTGVYRYLRHPMYLGFICWMIGSSLYAQSGIALILAGVYTVNICVWKALEEIQLMKTFPDYGEYRKRTFF